MIVHLVMSPYSVFQYPIDGVRIDVPDSFRPHCGDRLQVDNIRDTTSKLIGLDVLVVGVTWKLERTGVAVYSSMIMMLTVASEMPALPTTRRTHGKR